MRTILSRPVALVATLALTTAGLMGMASSANAQTSSLKFNCSASILSNQEFILDADITLPESVEVGDTVESSFTGSVTAPESVRGAAYSLLGGRFLEGTATIDGKFGSQALTLNADVPRAAIPSAGPGVVLPASGGGSWTANTAGEQNVTIDGFVGTLTMTKSDNTAQSLEVTCTAKDPAAVVGTVTVVEPTPEPEPTPDPTPTPDPEPTPDPTPTPDPEPTPPTTGPDPVKALVTAVLSVLKKLVCKIIKC